MALSIIAKRSAWPGVLGSMVLGLGLYVLERAESTPPRPIAVTTSPPAPPNPANVAENQHAASEVEAVATEQAEQAKAEGKTGKTSIEPDRILWRTADPEDMALIWAARIRPGSYRVKSARKLMFVLIAQVEDVETGRAYGLKAEGFHPQTEIKMSLEPIEGSRP